VLLIVGGVGMLGLCGICGLAGLLIPAVQKVSVAAQKAQSMNNVKQMSLATFSHEMAYGSFPLAYGTQAGAGPKQTFFTDLFPYIEQQPLYNTATSNGTQTASSNASVKVFNAPADPFNAGTSATISYACNSTLLGTDDKPRKMSDLKGRSSTLIVVFER